MTNLGINDQEGDHPVLFQVGVSTLSVSGLHLVGPLQMLQRHRGDVDPPVETHTQRKSSGCSHAHVQHTCSCWISNSCLQPAGRAQFVSQSKWVPIPFPGAKPSAALRQNPPTSRGFCSLLKSCVTLNVTIKWHQLDYFFIIIVLLTMLAEPWLVLINNPKSVLCETETRPAKNA